MACKTCGNRGWVHTAGGVRVCRCQVSPQAARNLVRTTVAEAMVQARAELVHLAQAGFLPLDAPMTFRVEMAAGATPDTPAAGGAVFTVSWENAEDAVEGGS